MTNEDAIKWLENLKQDIGQLRHEDLWPYAQTIDEIIATMEEQEEQIKNRDESLEKAREEIKWLRGMLKEQEAVEPIEVFKKDTNCHEYHCKRCGNKVGTILGGKHPILPVAKLSIEHFCDVCGQAVKWE